MTNEEKHGSFGRKSGFLLLWYFLWDDRTTFSSSVNSLLLRCTMLSFSTSFFLSGRSVSQLFALSYFSYSPRHTCYMSSLKLAWLLSHHSFEASVLFSWLSSRLEISLPLPFLYWKFEIGSPSLFCMKFYIIHRFIKD